MPLRPTSSILVGFLLATACAGGVREAPAEPSRIGDMSSPPSSVGGKAAEAPGGADPATTTLPDPNAEIPRNPARLAARLTEATMALHRAIDDWRSSGGTEAWPPPGAVVRLALDQQRIYQTLAGLGEDRRRSTIARLDPALRPEARDATYAAVRLATGLAGVVVDRPTAMRTRAPLPADTLHAYYERASRRFGVPWTLLAAVHFIETKFGRVISSSWAGAQGPMQFLPSTWEAFGLGGDIHDTRDAILGAANYLSATGSPHDDRAALWAYNPVAYYGDAVLAYDRLMRRDARAFYTLYNWQVFVRTRSGLVQLTGPGAEA